MAATKDNRGMSPAPKTNEPNPLKPEGQISLYLGHLLAKRGKSADDLAEAIDVSRATVFNWLGGVTSPPVKHWASIAKFLGLKDWRAMVPTNAFVDSLKSK